GGVMVVQTGAPSTVQTQTNTTFAFSSGAQRADVLRNPNLSSGQTLAHWFDTDAFAQPATNRFGNQGVGLVRADGIWNVNASIIRSLGGSVLPLAASLPGSGRPGGLSAS